MLGRLLAWGWGLHLFLRCGLGLLLRGWLRLATATVRGAAYGELRLLDIGEPCHVF